MAFIAEQAINHTHCSLMVPNFTSGAVARSGFFTTDQNPPSMGDFVCPTSNEFLQGFKTVSGGSPVAICAPILTEPRDADSPEVDLGVRTFPQRAIMRRNDTENFGVDLVNVGSDSVPGTDVTLDSVSMATPGKSRRTPLGSLVLRSCHSSEGGSTRSAHAAMSRST